jgi:hypothetical protein
VAGEDITIFYLTELQHLETCLQCASAYSQLVQMMLDAVTEMATAAHAISPLDVYTTILLQEVAPQAATMANLPQLIRDVAAALPFAFTRLPQSDTDISPRIIEDTFKSATTLSPNFLTAITRAIRHNLSALSAYLVGIANLAWSQDLDVQAALASRGYLLRTQSGGLRLAEPILGAQETGDKKLLFSRPVGRPLPLHVEVQVERLSDLTCQLRVRLNRPKSGHMAGQKIHLTYPGQAETSITDQNGLATFSPLPIAALSQLEILLET